MNELEFRATLGGGPIAGGTAIADSNAASAVNLYDGNNATGWASGITFPHWVGKDWGGSPVDVLAVGIRVENNANFVRGPLTFEVQYSPNLIEWRARAIFRTTAWTVANELRVFDMTPPTSQIEVYKAGPTHSLIGAHETDESVGKIIAHGLVGAYPDRESVAKIVNTALVGGYPDRLDVAGIRVSVLFQPVLSTRINGPVQII